MNEYKFEVILNFDPISGDQQTIGRRQEDQPQGEGRTDLVEKEGGV